MTPFRPHVHKHLKNVFNAPTLSFKYTIKKTQITTVSSLNYLHPEFKSARIRTYNVYLRLGTTSSDSKKFATQNKPSLYAECMLVLEMITVCGGKGV